MKKERFNHNSPVNKGINHAGRAYRRFLAFFFTVFTGIVSGFSLLFALVIITTAVGIYNPVIYAQEVYVNESDVNVRSGPGVDYSILGSLPYDYTFSPEGLETDEEGQEWYAFSWQDTTGYILAEYAKQRQEQEPEPAMTSDPEEETTQPAQADPEEETTHPAQADPEEETTQPAQADPEEETTRPEEGETQESEEAVTEEFSEQEQVLLESLFAPGSQAAWSGAVQSEAEFEAQLNSFPESYHPGLREIHEAYPNYRFQADYPGMDFWELVEAEQDKKVGDDFPESYRAMYDESFGYFENYDWDSDEWTMSEGRYTFASDEVIAFYLDPRNFLNPEEIYMFVRQSYSGNTTIDDLRSFLERTFLANGYTPNPFDEDDVRLNGDYAAVLMEAAQQSGVNPFVLATTIFSEQGYTGNSPMVEGYYEADDGTKYISYFNFFNFGATGSDYDDVIVNGMERARSEGWDSRFKSIVESSIVYGSNYINNDQDTFYYKNFNVMNGYNSLWHQYATSVSNSYSSGMMMKEVLEDSTYAALEFRIPVYENMPSAAAQLPEASDSKNNYYFADMQATGLEPEFTMANRDYTMTVTEDTTLSIAIPQWASYEGYDSYAISPGETQIRLDVRSQTGFLRSYNITVTSPVSCTLYVQTHEAEKLSIRDDTAIGDSGRGDANGDGKVSALDYIAIKNHIMEDEVITDEARLALADANNDGKVSSLDYIAIKNYIMSK